MSYAEAVKPQSEIINERLKAVERMWAHEDQFNASALAWAASYRMDIGHLLARLAAVEAERDMRLTEDESRTLAFKVDAAEARVEALTKAITHVIRDSPGTPDSVKSFLSRALSPLSPVPEQERNSDRPNI